MSGRPTPAIAQPPVSSRHAEVVVACALCAQVAAPSALRATCVPIPNDRQTSTTTCHDDNDTDHVENESRALSRLLRSRQSAGATATAGSGTRRRTLSAADGRRLQR